MRSHSIIVLGPLALAAPALGGCVKHAGSAEKGQSTTISEPKSDDRLFIQEIDLDSDGSPDIKNFFREGPDGPRHLVRKELDINRDGKTDVASYFDSDGNMYREDMDSDYDGVFDLTDSYLKGVRVKSEYDTDQDGEPNVFKYFTRADDGHMYLYRKDRDEDGDGRLDVKERFDQLGEVIRAARDTESDGKVDVDAK